MTDSRNKEMAEAAMHVCSQHGAQYSDIRISTSRNEEVHCRENKVSAINARISCGFGIRVLVNGCWGFAAASEISTAHITACARTACDQARAYASLRINPIELTKPTPVKATWQTPISKDPFSVPLSQKTELLLSLNASAMKRGASFCDSFIWSVHEQKYFLSSEGSEINQSFYRIWPQFTPVVVDSRSGRFQSRVSLTSPMGTGWEYVETFPLQQEVEMAVEGAKNKLRAPTVRPGTYDIILDPSHLWLTIHETCGHATELDRALGYEANYAGTSFITPDQREKLRYGSSAVTIMGNRSESGGLATCGFDDEGVSPQTFPIVKDGIFKSFQTTREHAGLIDDSQSMGCAFSDSWSHIPLQRMPNISLQPGSKPLSRAELIASTDKGLLFIGDNSWSIDQQRYNFQFSAQETWLIENGRVTSMVRDAAYQGTTVSFWNSCDALCDASEYKLGGSFFCGKGQPTQCAPVSHGSVPARFRNVTIISTDSL